MNIKDRFQALLDFYDMDVERFARKHKISVADCHRITPAVQAAVTKTIADEPLLRIRIYGR